MRKVPLFLSLILVTANAFAQYDYEFKILPYGNGVLSANESFVELGPEFNWNLVLKGKTFLVRPYLRMPLSDSREASIQLDRYAPKWRFVLASQYGKVNRLQCTSVDGYSVEAQLEYGYNQFMYFQSMHDSLAKTIYSSSYAAELKLFQYSSLKDYKSQQTSLQFRIRYEHVVLDAASVNVINSINSLGVASTSIKILEKPFVSTIFSPAFAYAFYPGQGSFTYIPAIYYNYFTRTDVSSDNSGRIRLEYNVFFYPLIREANVKIGLTPFVNVRVNGSDRFDRFLFGGQVSLRFGTAFLQYL